MPLFDPEMFSGPMDVDWDRIAERTESIAGLLTRADSVIMRSPIGTDLRLSIRGRTGHADTGILTAKGSFGNLPAGEVYIAPVEGTSEGVLVLEWSTTRRLSPRVNLTIKDGRAVGMAGDPEFLCSEIAEGRLIIPANIHHTNLEPMGIGIAPRCKVNANIGNSSLSSSEEEELAKLNICIKHGVDAVMDLSTGKNIHEIRERIIRNSPMPVGTVPIYEAVERVSDIYELTIDDLLDVIEIQARQGVDFMTVHCGLLHEFLPLAAKRVLGVVSRGGGIGRAH